MKDVRSAASFFSYGGGSAPVNSNSMSWNVDMVTTTGNLVVDLIHHFHLECGARIHKLRVYGTVKNPTAREVCAYLRVRGSLHAHAYALALKKITGVEVEKMLPTPNIELGAIPECEKYLAEGKHRRLYRFSPDDYAESAGIWGNGEVALPGDPPGELEVVDGLPEGGKIPELAGTTRPSRRTTRPRKSSRSRARWSRKAANSPYGGTMPNKFAIVTGASAGIGFELARQCAENGYDLLVAAENPEIEQAAAAIRNGAGTVEAVQADLSGPEGVDKLYAAAKGRKVDALLANAGRGLGHGFLDQQVADWRRVIDTNCTGTLLLLHKVGRDMRRSKPGASSSPVPSPDSCPAPTRPCTMPARPSSTASPSPSATS